MHSSLSSAFHSQLTTANSLREPSATQKRAIPSILAGRDVIVQDPNVHKGLTFAIPTLQKIDISSKTTQALILVPVRELAEEIQRCITTLAQDRDVECHACVGGTNIREDMARLKEGVHIVVGTPGRVKDMIIRKAKALPTKDVKIVCIDEADHMLSRSFNDQVDEIHRLLPQNKPLCADRYVRLRYE